jgi:DNA-directed RNA polymerase specialized sigma24 family protein
MEPAADPRLGNLSTHWTLIARAHAAGDGATNAQAAVLPRYCAAVYRHVLAKIGDADAAEDVCQEFAYRFVRGDFRHARPEKGRFRDYVAVAVKHLVGEFHRRKANEEKLLAFDSRTLAAAVASEDSEAAFRDQWRRELLNRAWAALRSECTGEPPTPYDVLRRKADEPSIPSAKLAEEFSARTGRAITAANARQLLHRARERFAAFLRMEVKESIPSTDPTDTDAELAELGLLVYVMPGE